MLYLLEINYSNPHRYIEPYLNMVRKYLTRHNVKLEDQIRYRFAVWLLNTEDYLEIKFRYPKEAQETIPIVKYTTDRKGNISKHIRCIKRKIYLPDEHRIRFDTLETMKNNLVCEYNDISVCFS